MVSLFFVMMGVISWWSLPRELYPPINYPELTVVTKYKDAAPEEIEILVTKLIEEGVGTVAGLKRLSSISKEELSVVIAEFAWGTPMDHAVARVREKLDLIKERLPRGAEEPVIIRVNPFDLPVVVLNLSGEVSPHELLKLGRERVKTELEKLEGVAAVHISGGQEREILVEVDQGRLQAANLPISQVVDGISRANLNYPAGTIKEAFYEYLIRTMGEFRVVREIPQIAVGVEELDPKNPKRPAEDPERKTPLARERGVGPEQRVILLRDVARVSDTFKERTSLARFNGRENLTLSIQKLAGANTVAVAERVRLAARQAAAGLPAGMTLEVVSDQSIAIRQSINGVRDSALLGGLLAFIFLLLFMGNFWAAVNVTFAIPLSILFTTFLMGRGGITMNMISMGGLALGIGMLVDSGIVVVENIVRLREQGQGDRRESAAAGAEEVFAAILGGVLTSIVVFVPMFLVVVGIAGQLIGELALTIVFALIASLLVSLTLTPMVASLSRGGGRSPLSFLMEGLNRLNLAGVRLFLRFKAASITGVLLTFAASFMIFGALPRELLPRVDQGQFTLQVNLPPGTRLNVTDQVVHRVEETLRGVPEIGDITVTIGSSKEGRAEELLETLGSHQARIFVSTKPRGERPFHLGGPRRTAEVVTDLKERLARQNLEGAQVEYLLQESPFKSALASGAPIVIEVQGQELHRLRDLSARVQEGLSRVSGLYGVQDTQIPPSPETKVHVMKDRAATYHLSVSDVALTAQTAVKGFEASQFKEQGREFDIRVRLRDEDRKDFNKVRRLLIHSPLGIEVPLSEVATFARGTGPTEIRRLDQQRTVLVSAQLAPNRSVSEALADVQRELDRIPVPAGYEVEITGEKEQMSESFGSLIWAVILSVILVYMVMAAVFESLWQPFLILLTIPMALIGVVAGLFLTGTPVSVMVGLGLIVLVGVVVNNGIVLVDHVNQLRAEGAALEPALLTASSDRLRPILLSTVTTLLGFLPLAMGLQAGVELLQPMAIATMGGLAAGTFLTLIFLPTIYAVGARFFEIFSPPGGGLSPDGTVPLSPPPPPVPAVPVTPAELDQPPAEPEVPPSEAPLEPPVSPSEPEGELPEIPEDFGSEEAVPEQEEPGAFLFPPLGGTPLPPDVSTAAPETEPEEPPPAEPEPTEEETPQPKEEPQEEESQDKPLFGVMAEPQEPSQPAEEPSQPPIEPVAPPEAPPAPPQESPALPQEEKSAQEEAAGSLNPRQKQLIEYLQAHERITRKEYAELTGASIPTAARDLKELADQGRIRGVGPLARGRYYTLA